MVYLSMVLPIGSDVKIERKSALNMCFTAGLSFFMSNALLDIQRWRRRERPARRFSWRRGGSSRLYGAGGGI